MFSEDTSQLSLEKPNLKLNTELSVLGADSASKWKKSFIRVSLRMHKAESNFFQEHISPNLTLNKHKKAEILPYLTTAKVHIYETFFKLSFQPRNTIQTCSIFLHACTQPNILQQCELNKAKRQNISQLQILETLWNKPFMATST